MGYWGEPFRGEAVLTRDLWGFIVAYTLEACRVTVSLLEMDEGTQTRRILSPHYPDLL